MELAAAAEGKLRLVAGVLFKVGGDQLRRCREVGGDGDLNLVGAFAAAVIEPSSATFSSKATRSSLRRPAIDGPPTTDSTLFIVITFTT
jgi:hypothetical protein